MVKEQFDFYNTVQQPSLHVPDLFHNQVVIDTSSPKKSSTHFRAWVRDLKLKTQWLHLTSDVIVYTDSAFHHADSRASFAICKLHYQVWNDYTDWCPAASSFDAKIRAIEKAIEIITNEPSPTHAYLFCNNKAAVGNYARKSPYLLSTTSYLILQQPGSSVGRAPGICPRGPGFKPQSGHFFSRSHDSQQLLPMPSSTLTSNQTKWSLYASICCSANGFQPAQTTCSQYISHLAILASKAMSVQMR